MLPSALVLTTKTWLPCGPGLLETLLQQRTGVLSDIVVHKFKLKVLSDSTGGGDNSIIPDKLCSC
jgi:hypothetical protein